MGKPLSTNKYIGEDNKKYLFEYFESDSFDILPQDKIKQCYGIAFYKNKLLIVNNVHKPGLYTPVGGSVEKGENPNDALIREIKEESNMKVLYFYPIGYQKVTEIGSVSEPYYQLRYFCIVEPYGPFISDPAGKVTEVIEVEPNNYKNYFNWGKIGDLIIKRAIEFKKNYNK